MSIFKQVKNKQYSTGKNKWMHDQKMPGIDEWHRYLGPCPDCGFLTFDYGGGWRCLETHCMRSANNLAPSVGAKPDWWETEVDIFLYGDLWCATADGFVNAQESACGFGKTPNEAVNDLKTKLVDTKITK